MVSLVPMPLASAVHVDLDLVRRYTRPGPRYTSYPTAPHFHAGYGSADFADALTAGDADAPLSLYLHLPFCRSLCYYCACHMKATRRPEVIERYLGSLIREIDLVAERLAPGRPVVQIHWGGGTPTYLTPEQIARLGDVLHDRFAVAADAEISLEADPRGLTEARLAAAASAGFNRISVGVQDVDPTVQAAINRVQPVSLVDDAVRWARRHGFESVNLDLVYGLPHQTAEGFARTLDVTRRLAPDRIALFSYAHVPRLKTHQRLIDPGALPTPDEKLRIFKTAMEALTGAGGYRFIGMDHFARPDDALALAQDRGELHRNFQGYSTRAGADVVALGVSGISQIDAPATAPTNAVSDATQGANEHGAYAQNVKGLPDYYNRIDAGRLGTYRGYRLSADDRLRRHVIMQLMCHFRVDKAEVETRFGVDFDAAFAEALDALAPMEDDGLVTRGETAVEVHDAGRLFVRNVAMAFDASLQATRPDARPAYSSTV